MIDKSKISLQFEELNRYLKDMEGLKQLSPESFLADQRNVYSLRYLLQVSIETCINIANHIISRNKLGIPKEYAEVFRILNQEKIISDELQTKLIQMTRFRNRLVHVYWDIDDKTIFEYLNTHLNDFHQFKTAITEFLQKSP